jgi:hypothetical protein
MSRLSDTIPKSRALRPSRKILIGNSREFAKDLIEISLLLDSSHYFRMNAKRSVFTCFLWVEHSPCEAPE